MRAGGLFHQRCEARGELVNDADAGRVNTLDRVIRHRIGLGALLFAAGRGKTGKTTLLRWIAETSFQRGSTPILADIDPSNASFSRYFDDVARPETDYPAGVARWLQQLIEHCVSEHQLAIVDLGGGDTTLRPLATEMPSKWNRVDHRLFSFITINWRRKPLRSYRTIVQLIAATTTDAGLRVRALLDEAKYPKGIKVTDAQLAAVNLMPHTFHGEWNYAISPHRQALRRRK